MRRDQVYSKIVTGLKVTLPLVALGLLSSVFLLSRAQRTDLDLTFAGTLDEGEVAQQEVNAPFYAGTTSQGDVVTITAQKAIPREEGLIAAEDLRAQVRLVGGGRLVVTSRGAEMREQDQNLMLQGDVEIESTTGYIMNTEAMTVRTDRVEGESHGPVTGKGPDGTLEAGKMRIQPLETTEDVQLLFTEGVKMVYVLQPLEKDDP
ncbi:MAG: LPS export ABC transporter periplasmic protein LptC [Pelagimonas sp.]|jgi:lipopolysaccharide export system protein LptC|nr:LPS export ABC transporter periplasmic protein LptC [Pelagimonas sp.]